MFLCFLPSLQWLQYTHLQNGLRVEVEFCSYLQLVHHTRVKSINLGRMRWNQNNGLISQNQLLVLIGYATLFPLCHPFFAKIQLCHPFFIMPPFFVYKKMGPKVVYRPRKFFYPKLQIGTPLKFFDLQHIPIQTISHISTKILHIFISHIWFINHTHFKCQL